MKFLDCPRLSLITSSFDDAIFGDRLVRGQTEAYSCKLAGDDKSLLKKLASDIQKENLTIPWVPELAPTKSAGLRLLVNFLSAMNASFPEYDFSEIGAEAFTVTKLDTAVKYANRNLATLYATNPGTISDLWAAIDEVIALRECKVVVFNPDNPDTHPYSEALWSYIFIFYNPKLHRMVLFGCSAWSSASPRITGDADEGSLV